MYRDLLFRVRALFRRRVMDEELREELRFHFDRQVERYEAAGLSHQEASRRARLALGGFDQAEEECRQARGIHIVETLIQDTRYGLRMLRRNPTFTAVVILTLAVGIGANTAMFSVVNALLLNPYRFPESDRIVSVEARHISGTNQNTGYRDFLDWREQNDVFVEMAIRPWTGGYTLSGQGEPERITGGQTTSGFLQVLGVRVALGRFFSAEEDQPGAPGVVVLSDAAWRRRFSARPDVLGRTLMLDNAPFTVIGVLPPKFAFPGIQTCEFFTALGESPSNGRFQHQYGVLARLKPGVPVSQAQSNMATITRRLEQQYPETNKGWGAVVMPIREAIARETRTPALILFATVSFVLLLVCANIAGLQLARTSARSREMAVRASLGASRLRIVCQMMTESVLVSVTGGAAGLLFAESLMKILQSNAAEELALDAALGLDKSVLLFTAGISILTGILSGLSPALYGSKCDLNAVIKGNSNTMGDARSRGRLLSCLMVGEVSLSVVLLIGAGLLLKDLSFMLRQETGLRTDHVLTFALAPARSQLESLQRATTFYQHLLERLGSSPGVDCAALVDTLPMTGGMTGGSFEVEGRVKAADWVETMVQYNGSTPGFFRVFGIPFLQGRDFSGSDTASSLPVAIVNRTLAGRFFPHESPIGQRFRDSYDGKWRTIVGVVDSYKHQMPTGAPVAQVFRPLAQTGLGWEWIALRTHGDPERLAGVVRGIVRTASPDAPIMQMRTMRQVVSDSLAQPRSMTELISGFAAFALLLAAIGIYGLVAYSVRQRLHEIGVRIALGASRGDVLRLIVRRGAGLSLLGILIGVPSALAASRVMSSLLYGISPLDVAVYISVPAVLILVALAASYLPARRAARVVPTMALRFE